MECTAAVLRRLTENLGAEESSVHDVSNAACTAPLIPPGLSDSKDVSLARRLLLQLLQEVCVL